MPAVQRNSSKESFYKSHKSGFDVIDYQWEISGLQHIGNLRDDVALKMRGILAHPVPFVILWSLLVDFSGAWSYYWPLSWLNWTCGGNGFIVSFGWKDWKSWPLSVCLWFFRLHWEGFQSWSGNCCICFLLSTLKRSWRESKKFLGTHGGTYWGWFFQGCGRQLGGTAQFYVVRWN